MNQANLKCPLCDAHINDDEFDPFMHFMKWHPYLLYKDGEWTQGVFEHLILVARGEMPLDEKFDKYVIRTASDHTRHAALLARHNSGLVLNTRITNYKSPSSDVTHASKRKRRP
jgi:hypothetical protein